MDPRRVLTFRQVAHERSFSRAARTLSLTQPSVSHQIAQLEREVGGKLFTRGPGGPRLTRAGEALLAHADVIAERFDLADDPARRDPARPGRPPADRRRPQRARPVSCPPHCSASERVTRARS